MKSALVRLGEPENERTPVGRVDRWASIKSRQFFNSLSLVCDLKDSISCLLKASLPSSRWSFIGNCRGITERKSDIVEKAMNVPSAK